MKRSTQASRLFLGPESSPGTPQSPKSKTPLEAGPRLVVIRHNSDSRGSGGSGAVQLTS